MTGSFSIERHPPADAVLPLQWLAGIALQELHHFDSTLGGCANCGLPERHCPFYLFGWELSRQALADPGSVPYNPP